MSHREIWCAEWNRLADLLMADGMSDEEAERYLGERPWLANDAVADRYAQQADALRDRMKDEELNR